MKISYNWLQETLGFAVSPEELAEKLAAAGSQVESITPLAAEIEGVVVAELISVKPHPNADKLSLTEVNDGITTYHVVCGAHNIAPGDRVPLAKVGAVLPGGFKIKESKIRGELSQGMLCSAEELQLAIVQASDGILQLPKSAPLGEDINEYLVLRDYILDIELTPDRGDLLSLRGLATEIGAILDSPFFLPSPHLQKGSGDYSIKIETELCAFYSGRLVEGVKVGPSPLWLQLRLLACGMRPVNNIVDAANYVMLEWGQPLHTFDADKLSTAGIVVRQARQGETMVTLDGKERNLDPCTMLITSGGRPVAIAGVMGSMDSEIDEETSRLLLESALFDPVSVRRTAKSLGISSEAGNRFEKGIDPEVAVIASQRAAMLISQLAGGSVGSLARAGSDESKMLVIDVDIDRVNALLGTDIPWETASEILKTLGLRVEEAGNIMKVRVTDRRRDLLVWQDIAEEIGRIYGFENISSTLPQGELTLGYRTRNQSLEWQVREMLVGCGLNEVVTYSFISPEAEEKSLSDPGVAIANPLTVEASVMRGAILPSLLGVVAFNFARGRDSVAIFEVGNIYKTGEPLPQQNLRVAGALAGKEPQHWQQPARGYDFYSLKGVVQQLLRNLGIEAEIRPHSHRQLHPSRGAAVYCRDSYLGCLGQVHPAIAEQWKLADVWFFDLEFTALAAAADKNICFAPPSRYPAVYRDLAVETDVETSAGSLLAIIRKAGGRLLEDLECFDVFTGGSLAETTKSLAFSLSFRHPQRTLQEKDVQKQMATIIRSLGEAGAHLRG